MSPPTPTTKHDDPAIPFDEVMLASPPAYSEAEAVAFVNDIFGLGAVAARSMTSECDQVFILSDEAGTLIGVAKVSNSAESIAMLDMEAAGVVHALRVDPSLPLLLPRVIPGSTGTGPETRRAAHRSNWLRLYEVAPGATRDDSLALSTDALSSWGETTARLAAALRSFTNPHAVRANPWDVQLTLASRPLVDYIDDVEARRAVAATFDRFETSVTPRWDRLRCQVIHTDLHLGNVLMSADGTITGIVDFGDMGFSAMVGDLASVIDAARVGRSMDDSFRVGRLIVDGYQRVTPLEQLELDVLTELVAARAAIGVAVTAWREATGRDITTSNTVRWRNEASTWLAEVIDAGWERAGTWLSGAIAPRSVAEWIELRDDTVGAALEPLSYDVPIHIESASGVWITTATGERLLDAYNNVPCVGHGHPRVATAIGRQARVLNTNMRYLHESTVELAERLIALSPPDLDSVLFVNSGSEANDLAWRLASNITGNSGALCTSFAYHGISDAIAPLSPEVIPSGHLPKHIETWHPTDTYRGLHTDGSPFDDALRRLHTHGHRPAISILDGVLQSDGVYDLEPTLVQSWLDRTHASGGLWIADEVQGGHGRTGDAMWSFERFGITPDFITLGKPMGNGFPVAAVITRREIAEAFRRDSIFFSTFGGNQVASMAALAVLDVLRDEDVLERVRRTGEALRSAIIDASGDDDRIGDVRGMGLANAIEIVKSRSTKEPDAEAASHLKNRLRHHGVLVGSTGRDRNILKVRPPLAFATCHVATFVESWRRALGDPIPI